MRLPCAACHDPPPHPTLAHGCVRQGYARGMCEAEGWRLPSPLTTPFHRTLQVALPLVARGCFNMYTGRGACVGVWVDCRVRGASGCFMRCRPAAAGARARRHCHARWFASDAVQARSSDAGRHSGSGAEGRKGAAQCSICGVLPPAYLEPWGPNQWGLCCGHPAAWRRCSATIRAAFPLPLTDRQQLRLLL